MTRIFTTGAEEADPVALWDAWDTDSRGARVPQSFGGTDMITWQPRTGRGMFFLDVLQYLRKDFGIVVTNTELFFGFAMRVRARVTGHFFQAFTDDPGVYANYMGLRLTAAGAVEATRSGTNVASSGAGVVIVDTWHYFEVWCKPLDVNGRFGVKVDGVLVIDFTGDTTAEEQFINAYQFTGVDMDNSLTAPTSFDDIVVNTPAGATNNTYPGAVRLMPIRPASAGLDADWARAGVDLGTDAAQARNGSYEFTMLQTADADDKVSFTPEVPDLPAGATITNIVINARARVDAGAGVIAPLVNANGTENISADQTLLSAWRYAQFAWPLNPEDAAAWQEADLALLKIGVSS